jgi:hypothetical protein
MDEEIRTDARVATLIVAALEGRLTDEALRRACL